jgi:hypothetical protein
LQKKWRLVVKAPPTTCAQEKWKLSLHAVPEHPSDAPLMPQAEHEIPCDRFLATMAL